MKFLILLLLSFSAFAQKIPHNMIVPYATADITGLQAALDLKANLTSPALLGIPTAPTAAPMNSSTQIATTKYVDDAILANSPVLDHGGLTGLLDDDHPQYHNDARGDARYFTQVQSTANFEPKNSNIQTHIASSSNPHAVTKAQVGLSNVLNVDTTTTTNITDSTNKRFVTDAEKTILGNTSGTNTGDQDLSSYAQTSDVVLKSDYTPAHSLLVQQSGTGSPVSLQIGNNTLVGRLSGGGSQINDLSASQVRTLLSIENVDNTSDLNKPVSTAQASADEAVQAFSIQRANHTGTQAPSTIIQDSSNRFTTDAEKAIWNGKQDALGFIPANDELSNLAGTAINANLLPDSDNTYDLGTSGLGWNRISARTIGYDGGTAIEFDSYLMFDSSSLVSVDFSKRFLYDGNDTISVQYNNRALLDSSGTEALSWQSRYLADDSEVQALDWIERRLWADDGATPVLDWSSNTGPTTFTQSPGDSSNKIATTEYVDNIAPTWKEHFGGGSNGNLTVSGPLILTNDVFYNTLTIAPGAAIETRGYRIFCKTLDLSNAPTNAFRANGANGGTATTQVGGAASLALLNGTIGGSGGGAVGVTGTTGAGAQAAVVSASTAANGGGAGAGGAGGNGTPNAGGASRPGSNNTTTKTSFVRITYDFFRTTTLIQGGVGAPGGSGGGGDGVNPGRGGGGGGAGGGVIAIYAQTIITSASTPAGVIQALGGNGGNGASGALGNVGGGGAGAGAGGGFVYLMYAQKVGPTVTNLIQCTGGAGGNGGNGAGTGQGGRGGGGGSGGRIVLYNVSTATGSEIVGVAGTVGGANSGITGGTGGPGGACNASL
jgi:hypothetical protein